MNTAQREMPDRDPAGRARREARRVAGAGSLALLAILTLATSGAGATARTDAPPAERAVAVLEGPRETAPGPELPAPAPQAGEAEEGAQPFIADDLRAPELA